jgi:uncharacterized protein (DUF2236 family)
MLIPPDRKAYTDYIKHYRDRLLIVELEKEHIGKLKEGYQFRSD